uniref:Uncharacterized protein n=1 Tax=Euplotes harpa TaxID=151035 RepID=A0A7S3J8Q0_9SPIT|mmetsp:Transcript_260/g.254  ORF Transcript_260/g.254 Transcript_260/m.254 type:complete len:149 (+) Transcript_260:1-447(+)
MDKRQSQHQIFEQTAAQAKKMRASRSIDYCGEEDVRLPPIKGGLEQSQTMGGSPGNSKERLYQIRKHLKEGKLKGKLSNKYNVDRLFPIYGCFDSKSVFKTTTKTLQAKFEEREPLTPSSLQYFHKNDFMKKYTEEMLKAKNMMNNKH